MSSYTILFTVSILGLFLLFALAFNGSVGETFVNYSFFTSATLMIAFGSSKIAKAKYSITMSLGIASTMFYLPMIWQRFNFSYTDISEGIYFDFWVIAILLVSLICKPNKSLKQIGAKDASPS
jgi:hypothetical protein